MPIYEYYCSKCRREVAVTMSIREHEQAKVKCLSVEAKPSNRC